MTDELAVRAVAAPTWEIRPERAADIDLIHDLHRAAFPGRAEADLVDAIRSGPHFVPELSLVAATPDGSVLGHALFSRVEHVSDASDAPTPALALAPLAVLPPHQGAGIGTALVGAGLAAADARDEPLVAVVGPPAFYGRFGFVPAATFGITSAYDEAGEAFQVRPRRGTDGLPPGRLVYPAAFSGV